MQRRDMENKEYYMNALKSLHEELKRFKVREIGVFGSVVRGVQKQTSDLDVLVDFTDDELRDGVLKEVVMV